MLDHGDRGRNHLVAARNVVCRRGLPRWSRRPREVQCLRALRVSDLIPAGAPTLRCRVGTRPLAHRGRPVCSLWAWPAQRKRGISMQLSSTSRGAQRVVLCLPPPGRLTVSPKSPRCPGGLSHGRRDSNPQPSVLETDALPFELHPLGCSGHEERATCRMAGDPFSGVSSPHIEITVARLRH